MRDAPAGEDVFARFDASGVLVGLDVMRAPSSPARAVALVDALAAAVARDVGPPAKAEAPLEVATLEAPGIVTRTVEYRFRDFAVDVGVSRLAPTGPIVVREQYRAVQ